jgi:hypothetical protein
VPETSDIGTSVESAKRPLLAGVGAGFLIAVVAFVANFIIASALAFLFEEAIESVTGPMSGALAPIAVGLVVVGELWLLLWLRAADTDPFARIMNSTLFLLTPIYLFLPFGLALHSLLFDSPSA